MARLNEPPPAPATASAQPVVESVDVLKRRFIRQNRELAKNNSAQSLRIRTLETEVSHLTVENFNLRERVLQLENEVGNAHVRASTDAVERVKADLQAKIAELGDLVLGLDSFKAQKEQHNETDGERPQMQGNWLERQTLLEFMRENQMPTITEDKQYPRRTLNGDQIQAIRLSDHSSQDSPDLGPPPVAHFDYEDPVKQVSPSANRTVSAPAAEDLPANFSANLETRRKRKDTQPKLEIRRHSIMAQSPKKSTTEPPAMLRTGAKRKLADREVEQTIKPPSKDDFTFSRRAMPTATDAVPDEETIECKPILAKPARKVLGDKTTNMSPRKVSSKPEKTEKPEKDMDAEGNKKVPAPKFDTSTSRSQARARRISSIPLPSPGEVVETVEIPLANEPQLHELDPKTPAALDLLSPTPTESRDTPPPTVSGEGIRPSRRARAAVNYAEPSLVAKMRRPGKQMADAVTGLQDPRRAMSTSTEKKSASARSVSIKSEPDSDYAWKSIPSATRIEAASPLTTKSTSDDSSVRAEDLPGSEKIVPSSTQASASSTVISSLIAASSASSSSNRVRRESLTAKARQAEKPLGTDITVDASAAAVAKKLQELDLYEFKESSSPPHEPSQRVTAAARAQRRHSSVPKNLPTIDRKAATDVSDSVSSLSTAGGRSERAASRRKSMML